MDSPSSGRDSQGRRRRYLVLYDDQCEICQAGIAWLRLLDRRGFCRPQPIDPAILASFEPPLKLEDCLRELHVVTPRGEVRRGWEAVATLARRFFWTWPIGVAGRVPPCSWLGEFGYRLVARNRYALSKCRGGACNAARPESVRRSSSTTAFWTCYTTGMLLRAPLIAGAAAAGTFQRTGAYLRTFRRRLDLLDGRLSICFLGGVRPDLVPLVFGELFTMIVYDDVAIDPGSPRMRRSLERHLRRLPAGRIRKVVATHHHEEHVGNLNWLSGRTGAPIHLSEATARLLTPPHPLPWARRVIIGQPPPLEPPYEPLGKSLQTARGRLQVYPAPGHSDDHVVLYDPEQRLLLAGDAFMGSYFSTPNPDVDSRRWIETLERLLELDIAILVEGHGHVHTLRREVPDAAGVVNRQDPREALAEKLRLLRWVRRQVEAGLQDGLPAGMIEASCFPWGQSWAWERFASDELTRLFSLGHFSRSELVRSFVREGGEILPTVFEMRLHGSESPAERMRDERGP